MHGEQNQKLKGGFVNVKVRYRSQNESIGRVSGGTLSIAFEGEEIYFKFGLKAR
jgi:hypothetical protein